VQNYKIFLTIDKDSWLFLQINDNLKLLWQCKLLTHSVQELS